MTIVAPGNGTVEPKSTEAATAAAAAAEASARVAVVHNAPGPSGFTAGGRHCNPAATVADITFGPAR